MRPLPWRDPHWQFNALLFLVVVLSVAAIFCTPICRGAESAACPPLATVKPVLMIDHNAYSKASRDLLAEYKRDGSTLAPWLRERYTIRWRHAWPTPDLPRFWRNGRLVGNGWAGERRLRVLLGDQTPPTVGAPVAPILDSQLSGLRTSLASVESRFEQADQNFTDELTALGEQLGTKFGEVDARLTETDRRMTATTDRNLVDVRERREYKKSFDNLKQQQTENTTLIGTLRAKVGERIRQATPDGLWGLGSTVTKGLALAGMIGTGGIGGLLGGWLLRKAGRTLLRKARGKPDGSAENDDAGFQNMTIRSEYDILSEPNDCLKCKVSARRIESLNEEIARLRELVDRPISDTTREQLAEREAEVRQLESEKRGLEIVARTLTSDLKECRDRPQPTERIVRVPDDTEQRWRRAMEMVRREYPTTPSYDAYRKLVEKHYDLLKSGDGINHGD